MKNIRVFRESAGLSQSDLGRIIGASKHSISRWENGRRAPTLARVMSICRALGVSLDEMTGASGVPIIRRG